MPAIETIKKLAEKATGWARPDAALLRDLVRPRKPRTFRFKDDGLIPNHPDFALIVYRGAVRLRRELDPAAVYEDLFAKTAGGIPGATASMITSIIIRRSMRCSALRAAKAGCSSAAREVAPSR
jgi:hypothetical protein